MRILSSAPAALKITHIYRASLVAQLVKNLPSVQDTVVQFLGCEDPLEKEVVKHSSILTWRNHGLRSLAGYGPWGSKGDRHN